MSSRQRKFTFQIIVLLLLSMGSFTLAEVALRIWRADVAFQPDPDLIRSLRPNTMQNFYSYETDDNLNGRSHSIPDEPQFIAVMKTNNLGLRMLEDIGQKGADEKRVLIFGDSYTEALQVEPSKRFSDLTGVKLQESTDGKWRLINGGITNGNPAQYLMMLREMGKTIKPDLVVIILAPNELDEDTVWEARYGFVRDEAGVPLRPKTTGWLALTKSSYAIRYFYSQLRRHWPDGLEFFFPSADPTLERIPWTELACGNTERSREAFRERTGRQLDMLKTMSAEFGADFAVLAIHYQWYFPNEPYYEKRFPELEDFLNNHDCAGSRGIKYEAFLLDHMRAHGIPFVSTYQRFTEAKEKNPMHKLWNFYDYHFSPTGHELVAEDLYQLILERITSPPANSF